MLVKLTPGIKPLIKEIMSLVFYRCAPVTC
jgi:hypothetical protein